MQEGTGNHPRITEADLQKTIRIIYIDVQNLSQINWYLKIPIDKSAELQRPSEIEH